MQHQNLHNASTLLLLTRILLTKMLNLDLAVLLLLAMQTIASNRKVMRCKMTLLCKMYNLIEAENRSENSALEALFLLTDH